MQSEKCPIAPQQLYALLLNDSELALLDVREARAFVGAHLNLARMTPLSGLELDLRALVPRLTTPVVLIDEGDADGPAATAARLLSRMGYSDVCVLAGGMAAWRAESLSLIDGYGTLVKAFGDQVRIRREVPTVRGTAIRESQVADDRFTLIDVRPADEYAFLSLPGTGNHAGTELALRDWSEAGSSASSASPSPWVLNCFSRTRAIIGTATLRLLGHPDAHFLEDGVMRWALDGAPVAQNAQPAPDLPVAGDDELRRRADALIARYSLRVIDPDSLARMRGDADRTLYVFDLRPHSGAVAPDSWVRKVPGGQLLMHFEHLIGTRGARVVLMDDAHRLRAAVSAFWLTQLDQVKVFILNGEPPSWRPGDGDGAQRVSDETADANGITAEALAALRQECAGRIDVVDVGPSADFENHHLPDALYLLPFTLDPLEAVVVSGQTRDDGRYIVFTSPDGRAARIVTREVRERWPSCEALWLIGGTEGWRNAGLPTEKLWEAEQLLTAFEDDWGSVMRVTEERRDGVWESYLHWERGLGDRVMRDPTVSFRLF
ncbi:rhodanese-like domain-containing protein [Variovorax sp. RHLX14]|uniref:rhodanese-like domain-containing protein n=1 Tax=Variovorax sp. RHLX14 TaxID=1259731 RepID=UPI003F45D53C